MLISMLVMHKC